MLQNSRGFSVFFGITGFQGFHVFFVFSSPARTKSLRKPIKTRTNKESYQSMSNSHRYARADPMPKRVHETTTHRIKTKKTNKLRVPCRFVVLDLVGTYLEFVCFSCCLAFLFFSCFNDFATLFIDAFEF